MELFNLFVIIFVLTSVSCAGFDVNSDNKPIEIPKSLNLVKNATPPHGRDNDKSNFVELPTYSLYLIGFIMLFMLIAIIGLAVALYLMIKNKQIFGHNIRNKEYIRQESTGVEALYNSNYDEQNKNNGSTLTMNSGIIEINRISDPVTPTRLEDSKIIFTKRLVKPIVPVMQRGQMDAICKEVLRKVQKSDSASFRDLNELLNVKSEDKHELKYDAVKELEKETKTEVKNESQQESKFTTVAEAIAKMNIETKNDPKIDSKNETSNDTKFDNRNETINEIKTEIKHEASKDVQIEISNVEGDRSTEDSETETEYDTVPSPIRYRHSGAESDDFDIDNVYDLPPRRSYDEKSRNMIQMDPDSQYLLPISTGITDSCYINAKRNSFNSSS